jgi:hypothetical protein
MSKGKEVVPAYSLGASPNGDTCCLWGRPGVQRCHSLYPSKSEGHVIRIGVAHNHFSTFRGLDAVRSPAEGNRFFVIGKVVSTMHVDYTPVRIHMQGDHRSHLYQASNLV